MSVFQQLFNITRSIITLRRFVSWLVYTLLLVAIPSMSAFASPITQEFQAGTGGPAGTGPSIANQSVTMRTNTNNPTGTTFAAATNPLTVTLSLSNFQHSVATSAISTGRAIDFGMTGPASGTTYAGTAFYATLNGIGSPTDSLFSSLPSTVGQGISVTNNGAIEIMLSTLPLFTANSPTNGRYYYGDLTVSFSRPLTNPTLHFSGLGGSLQTTVNNVTTILGITAELDLDTAANPSVTLSKISGNSSISVSSNQILNSATQPNSSCALNQAACGSILATGNAISSLKFKVYLRGDGGMATWPTNGNTGGDVFYFAGVSVLDEYDYGDAPDTGVGTGTGNYQTTAADNGPRHVATGLTLGLNRDADSGTLQNASATADDTTGTPNDEDGITLPASFAQGASTTISATASGSGFLSAWIDWNHDGDFADAGEQIANDLAVNAGSNTINVTVPGTATPGSSFARFRICAATAECNSATGIASDGEVEDYAVTITAPPPLVCLANAVTNGTFDTTLNGWTNGGSWEISNSQAVNYDNTNTSFPLSQTLSNIEVSSGYLTLYFSVKSTNCGGCTAPSTTNLDVTFNGTTYANFYGDANNNVTPSVLNGAVMSPTTSFAQGTMQAMTLQIPWSGASPASGTLAFVHRPAGGQDDNWVDSVSVCAIPYDYGDAPATYGTPSHRIVSGIYLGTNAPDSENAPPTPLDGTGDDVTGTDDEDGITLPTLTQGQTATITAKVSGTGGYLQGWIDWNGNGTFDAGEQVATNLQDNGVGDTDNTTGKIAFTVSVPATATTNKTYARFRWSTTKDLNATIAASDGEVEDYALTVTAPPPLVCRANAVTNGTFDTTLNGWTNGGSWQVAGNLAVNSDNTNASFPLSQSLSNIEVNAGYLTVYFSMASNNCNSCSGPSTTNLDVTFNGTTYANFYSNASDVVTPTALNGAVLSPSTPFAQTTMSALTLTNFTLQIPWSGASPASGSLAFVHRPAGGQDDNWVDNVSVCALPYDYGDAPASYGTPSHAIIAGLHLGATIDSEAAAQPTPAADGDGSDEDGVFTDAGLTSSLQAKSFKLEEAMNLHIPVTGSGKLYAWIDWDGDGTFGNNADELIANGVSANNETLTVVTHVPLTAKGGTTYARFRLSNDVAAASPTGAASDGEVEDYQITVDTTPTAPTATAPANCAASGNSGTWTASGGGYQTSTAEGLTITATASAPAGAKWTFIPNDALNTNGVFGNPALNGIPSLSTIYTWDTAPEDGRNANASTDGKTGTLTFTFGAPVVNPVVYIDRLGGYGGNSSASPQQLSNSARITPNAANAAATFTRLAGTTHFEVTSNAIQRTPNETLVWGQSSGESGTDSTRYTAMGGVQVNGTYTSLSLDLAGVGVEGAGADGIEFVVCGSAPQYDYSDAPATYGTPTHMIVSGIYLGANAPDSENAQPTPLDGTGDDVTGTDDEDGITLPALTQGQTATINATVNGAGGYLQGWIDWNGNGTFEAGEQVATNLQDNGVGDTDNTTGKIAFSVTVPATATTTKTYARFRWSTTKDLNATAAANDGEVEDYALTIISVADLAVVKTDGVTSVSSGGTTTYTITVINNGPSASTATLTDPAVTGLSKTAVACGTTPGVCTTAPTIANLEAGFSTPSIPSGGTYQLRVTTNVTASSGNVSNTATVATPSGTTDPTASNNSSTDTDTIASTTCDASANAGMQLSGSATLNASNEIVLTTATKQQAGTAWSKQPISLANAFSLRFKVYLGTLDATGADGISFAFQRAPAGSSAVGAAGGGLGIGTLDPAVGIEFDTWDNTPYNGASYMDISNDHTVIYKPTSYTGLIGGGAGSLISSVVDLGNIEDGAWHVAQLDWNPSTKLLTYSFDGVTRASVTRDLIATDFAGNPLVYYGFAASTGDYYNQQSACIITAPAAVSLDYSDAPASYGTPSHAISGSLKLGANAPDAESAALPNATATGDDANGTDDEDGVSVFPTLTAGATSYSIPAANISATGTGTLHAWIDFDKNGAFTANEYAAVTVSNGTLSGALNWSGITVGSTGTTYARFRFTSSTLTDNTSTTTVDERAISAAAADGEVEDYAVTITQFAVCAPTTLQNALDGRLVQWTFNADEPSGAPANHLHAQLVNPTYITSGADVAFLNLGATQSNTATVITSNSIPATLPSNRYIDYRFTTSNFTNTAELYGFGMGIYADARPTYTYRTGAYNLRILLDTDPAFGSPITLINSLPIDDSQPSLGALKSNPRLDTGFDWYYYNHYQFDQVVTLLPSKTYYVRVYPFNVTRNGYDSATNNSSIIVFDDFGLKAAGCGSISQITGKVFDDVNYGGNAGRPATVAGAAGVNSAQVELYSSTGAYLTNTTTAADGTYSFTNLSSGSYYVRVVNSTVKSTRSGSDGTERGIQTYRTDGTNAVTNEVGGRKPALVDAATNTTNQTLNTTTFVLSGGGQAQSVQPVTISTSNISGVNFGFNFSTVVNTNDSGQGSLRQTILNANLLANTGMAQTGQNNTYGADTSVTKEVLLFNIPAANDPLGRADICGGSTCKITVNSQLPNITAPLIVDGSSQPGYVAGTPGIPRIQIVPASGLDARGMTVYYTATDSTIRALSITDFRTRNTNVAIDLQAERTIIESCYLGVDPSGVVAPNGSGIQLEWTQSAVIGGSTTAKRNIISGNLVLGIFFDTGASGSVIQNNYIGTNPAGTAAMGNGSSGLDTESGSGTKILDNVIAGNIGNGIELGFTSGGPGLNSAIIQGNRIGVGVNGEALGNAVGIVNYGVSNNHLIGGTSAGQGNIIAYNQTGGVTMYNNNSTGTIISANSIYANGGLGIDLGYNGVTVNDANDTDSGANNLLNFPIISNISIANNNLTVQGCAPSGATVELFKADVSPNGKAIPGDNKLGKSKDYGEGQTYLASFVEGSASDSDATTCASTIDADGNNQTGMKAFSVTIPAPSAFASGDSMTATATITNTGTSEFSPDFLYDASCKLVVITTADTDNSTNNSGSLRDAIECANATPGIDTISFNIPKTEAGFTNPDGVANSGDEYWRISLNSQLPSITEGVIIDGRTQTTNKGNTNSGNVATATTAGVDNIALPAVSAPEVEIVGQWFGAGFDIRASNVSIYNLGMRLFDTDIRMDQANTTGILFNGMALGVNPVDGSDPGNGQRSNQHLAVNASGVSFVLTNSILGYNDNKRGIVTGQYNNVSDISATISGNHFVGIGLAGNSENAAIEILRTQNPNITITGNRFIGRGAASATDLAIEFNDYGGGNTTCVNCRVENNTINGFHDGVGYFTDASLTGLIINKNRIFNNTEFAVFLGNVQNASIVQNYLYDNGKSGVLINKDPARGNIISQNSIYHNGEIGINLAGGNQIDPGGITLDDANDSDNGPNTLLNFPLFKVSGDTAATTLTLTGCAPAGSTVEIFEADVSPGGAATLGANKFGQSSDYGEGQTYLASFVEGSAADTDTSSCTLSTDSDGNNPSGLKAFSVTLPKPNTVTEGDLLTATATLTASGTSEFSPVATYTIPATLSGTIFDDVNYGGGAGRPLNADTSIKGVAGTLIEVYSSSGLLTDKATTDNNGKFSVTLPRNATYYLRVVSDSVNSSRSGSTGAELGIMTYRSAGGIGVTNEIGGRFPYRADAAANTSGATLNTNTGLFQGGALNGQPAQVVQSINLTASVANINIGFNFDTVVNANDSGQGSLRQVLLNANLLGNEANLTQTNRVNGKEAVIFALTTADPNYNSTATTWTVPLVSALPIITQPLVIDATTQAGFIDKPVIALDGSSTGNGDGLTLGAGSNGSLIQALAIHHSAGAGIGIVDSADNLIGGTLSGQGNVLISNQGDGIRVVGNTALNNSLLGNSINFNGGLGIDLGDDGVTANDALDADTGPNHFLNYPVVTFNGFGTNGTRILAYDLSLDAPVGNYRLEFFTSPTADASGYGEGQVFLGAKTISQPSAGSVSIRGTINTNQPVAAGAFISTTLTTQTASGFGSTSEFSAQKAGTNTSVCQDLTTNTGNQIVMVDENMQPLAMIKAKDSTGAYINYVISGGLDKNLFIINNPTPGATIDCSTITFVSLGTVSARSASTTGTTQAAKLPSIGNFEVPLDSNHDNIYEVQITATFASGQKVVRDLRYQIVNVNEAPVITSPTNVSITEHTGLKALTVATYDPDQPETLSFKISGGNDQNQFTIDAKTGDLSFRNEPDYESPTDANQDNVYSVEVTVTDAGGLSYAKTFIITVQNDTNDDGIVLSSKVLLQGAYDRKSGLMQATLNSLGLLPMQQPYQAAPFNYAGKEIRFKTTTAVTEPTSVVDWVLLELRNSKQEVVATKAALVQRNGVVVNAQTGAPLIPFTNVKPDNYYLNLRHRNHLGVMTQKPVAFSATPVEVDFTNPATLVKGSDTRLVAGSTALLWAGDLNGSQTLSASGPNNDITSMLNSVLTDEANTLAVTNWSLNRYDANDVNMDGRVLFTGPNNDANMLLGNILLHPQNSALASNFVIRGSLVQ